MLKKTIFHSTKELSSMLAFLKLSRLITSPALCSMTLIWCLKQTLQSTIVLRHRRWMQTQLQTSDHLNLDLGDVAHGSVSVKVEVQADLPHLPGGHHSHGTLSVQDHWGLQQQVLGMGRRGWWHVLQASVIKYRKVHYVKIQNVGWSDTTLLSTDTMEAKQGSRCWNMIL